MHSLLQSRHKKYWACTLIWAITVYGLIRQWNAIYSLYLQTLCYILSKQFYWWWKPEYCGVNHRPAAITDKLYHIIWHWAHLAWVGFDLKTLVVIETDCIGGCKSNYHTITTTDLPQVTENFITYCCIEYTSPWARFELTVFMVISNDYTGSMYPTTIRSRRRRSLSVQKTITVFHPIRNITHILFKIY